MPHGGSEGEKQGLRPGPKEVLLVGSELVHGQYFPLLEIGISKQRDDKIG